MRLLILSVIVLFQSHWIDDVGSGASDTAGLVVSAIGTLAMGAGLALRSWTAGRVLLAAGLVFAALISVADVVGLQTDGSRTRDIAAHRATGLGWNATVSVTATLVGALAALTLLGLGRGRD